MGVGMIIGSFGSILSFIGALFCTIFYEWKRNSQVASQNSLQNLYHAEGLWMRCVIPVPGRMSCDYYDATLFDVPGYLQALRALSIISCLFLFCSILCDILALDCVDQVTKSTKVWLARIGGCSSLLGGVMLIAAVSWYASVVIREFNTFVYPEETFKYTFGAALYVGWIAGGVAVICGAVVLCVSCKSNFEDDDDRPMYPYKAPKSRTNEEYV